MEMEVDFWDLLITMFSNIFTYSDYMLVTMILNFMLVITQPLEISSSAAYAVAFYMITIVAPIVGIIDGLINYGSQSVAKNDFKTLNLLWR